MFKEKGEQFKGLKYLPTEPILNEIYNPVVRTSIRETIKVINAIVKKYGELEAIYIEMPRETNTQEEKKKITKMQAENEQYKKKSIQKAQAEYAFSDEVYRGHKDLNTKIRLWYEQKEHCLYSGKKISMYDLVHYPDKFDIDHIIPKSVSFDDSLSNKILCYASENRAKGQQTPFYYFKRKTSLEWTYESYKEYITKKLYNDGKGDLTRNKMELLLFEDNINKYEVRQKFISRNLNDTRYASRVILNSLQQFIKQNNQSTKIAIVRGKFTATLRRKWQIEKNRDESYAHHAVDALVVASVNYLKLWEKTKNPVLEVDEQVVDIKTGEILNSDYDTLVYQEPFNKFLAQVDEAKRNCKYSHKVDKKVNRQVTDQTIYSTRQGVTKDSKTKSFIKDEAATEHYVVGKLKDIYSDADAENFIKRYKKDKTQFLMYHHDSQTFAILEQIMHTYSDEKNPFLAYKKEYGEIRKYSKKSNGPAVKMIKYFDSKLGNHIEVKQENPKDKKVILQSLNPWRTDVYYDRDKEKYIVVGLKYSDLRYQKGGEYGITVNKYVEILDANDISLSSTDINNLITNNQQPVRYEFCFSLYENNFVRYLTDKQEYNYRFISSTTRNRILPKAISSNVAMEKVTVSKVSNFVKMNVDVLGNFHVINREKLTLKFKK